MSHYTVLVIGDDVEKQLAPYHEFECTGIDEYIQEIDQTEEARATYAGNTTTRYKDPEGNLHDPYTADGDAKPEFYRDPTPEEEAKHGKMFGSGCGGGIQWLSKDWGDGQGYRAKVKYLPEGWCEVEIPTNTVESFVDFIKGWYGHSVVLFGEQPDLARDHKYGYTLVDANGEVTKVIDRTNPNSKWDWYKVGGRWNGFFKVKPSATFVLVGEPGLQNMNDDYEPPAKDRADICMKGDVDIEGMQQEAEDEAAKQYDLVTAIIGNLPLHSSWEDIQKRHVQTVNPHQVNWDAARDEYNAQPAVKALRDHKETIWFEPDKFLVSRPQYLQQARETALSTFAVVKDGQWYERGKMGWFACVSDEKNRDEWNAQFSRLIDELPDNTLLTIVDCHI